ncbi:cation-translocating P-type ATPase [Gluconacetobacter aggeris]|uniref:cation-translocating P-type ATPase n=1 Tax=Gluconacetobacter aggeris TaxID=1286186 RepID=UPI00308466E9
MDQPAEALDRPASLAGLSEQQAQARLKTDGFNELPRQEHRTPLAIVGEVLREPMLALLLVGGGIYLLLGDVQEALILLAFACASIAITTVQETRTERVLDALRDLTSPRALVIRDGTRRRIPGREVVRGDLIVLGEGDRVPADAVLVQAQDLLADESLLTGEAVAVRKSVATTVPPTARPGGDDLPFVYSGALIVRGSGLAEVHATGAASEIGRIGQSLRMLDTEPPRLRAQMARLTRLCAIGGSAVSALALILYGTLRGGWLDAVLAAITIGMSMLPEEFPVVLTVFMAMGAWRISRARVLTRRAASIETLGSATVLCTDKTGTLTENRMSIVELRPADNATIAPPTPLTALTPQAQALALHGLLASAPQPFDPMETAFHAFARTALPDTQLPSRAGWTLARTYGLRPDLLAVTQAWRPDAAKPACIIAAKGAPEAIAALCHLDDTRRTAIRQALDAMAAQGLRVLGIAKGAYEGEDFPETPHGFTLTFLGLVGIADPLRPSVPAAVRDCRTAGIRIMMITGDYPETARAIARAAGIDAGATVLTGDAIATLSQPDLQQRARTATVCARIMPEQKLRIVQALKADDAIVAMTGDGVNDAPSLKAAHIGIAMGGRGTDVAREAAAIVLLDDDFGSIVTAIRLGRRIYDNLRKAMGFIFAVHVPIAGLALLPLVLGDPIIFAPIHIAFLEMVIDPVCTLAFEAETEEDDIMRRPPRPPSEPLFSPPLIVWSLLQGLLVFILVGGIFMFATLRAMPADELRALTFVSLVLSIVSLILVNRSFSTSLVTAIRRPNATLVWILAMVVAVLAASVLAPPIRGLFRFGPLHWHDLALILAVAATVLIVLETAKIFWRDRLRF